MSQRNPMNDRYQTDEHVGKTRKSAASAKPKTKAAATVRVQSTKKPQKKGFFGGGGGGNQQSKSAKKLEREKRAELNRKYYHPPTREYQRMRKLWWGLIIGAIVCGVVTFAGQQLLPTPLVYVLLAVTYLLAVAALLLDSMKIRKLRRIYQDQMEHKSKDIRAMEKAERAAQKAQQRAAKEASEGEPAKEEEPKKRGLFGSGFRLSKAEKEKAAKGSSDEPADQSETSAREAASTEPAKTGKQNKASK